MKFSKLLGILILCCLANIIGFSQEENDYSEEESISEKLIGTYLELGYISEGSNQLGGGILFKSAIEYRLRSNNSIFFRLNTDNYDIDYFLPKNNHFPTDINGSASFTDLILGVGYRGGSEYLRYYTLLQSGFKQYSFPMVAQTGEAILVFPDGGSALTSRLTAGIEYYFDSTFAFTVDIFYNHVLDEKDFWTRKQGAWGISIGLVGSFF